MNIQHLYHHVAIQAEAGETISSLGYKTLCQGDMPACVRPYAVIRDGECRLLYSTGSMVPLRSRFSFITEDQHRLSRAVLSRLALVLCAIEDKPFLDKAFLVAEPDDIFVKTENGEICFLIAPYNTEDEQQQYYTWGKSLSALVCRLTEKGTDWYDKAQMASDGLMKGDTNPLEELLRAIRSLAHKSGMSHTAADTFTGELEMRYKDKEGSLAFFVRKPEFIIGKDAQADGVIEHNQAVSRRHCAIRRHTDGWYVSDLASTNHTYVDGRKLLPDEEVPLHDGSILRVADMGFHVTIR